MRRGGFVFLTVLMLIAIAATVIGAGLMRAGVRARVVHDQMESYRRHHEMLGVRDTVFTWLRRSSDEQLAELMASGENAQRIELDSGVTIIITVRDGQGTLLIPSVEGDANPTQHAWLLQALSRLPSERVDQLTRRSGPATVSFQAAPEAVLRAVGRGEAAAEVLIAAQREGVDDTRALQERLSETGLSQSEAAMIARRFVFRPKLWRFETEAFHPELGVSRRYVVLGEAGSLPRIHEWRTVASPTTPSTGTAGLGGR